VELCCVGVGVGVGVAFAFAATSDTLLIFYGSLVSHQKH
jgi:hypothetical protein